VTIFIFALKRFFRKKSNIITLIFFTLATILLPTQEYVALPLGFQYYGALQMMLATRLVAIILEDRVKGTQLRIGVAPITEFQYLFQNLLAYSMLLILQNVVVTIGGIVVHGSNIVNPLMLFVLYTCFSLTSVAFVLAWYSLFRSKEIASLILTNLILFMAMLGGIFWPVSIMPSTLQRIAMLLPTYWLTKGIEVITIGQNLGDITLPLTIILMFTLGFLFLGSKRRIA